MGVKRYTIQGFRDYRGVSLEDIIEDLEEDFQHSMREYIDKLNKLKEDVSANLERLDDPEEILGYIDYCNSFYEGFESDFKRLVKELPYKVEDRHIDIINQIYEASIFEKKHSCKVFHDDHIARKLKDESLRPLVDNIDSLSDGAFFNNWVLIDLNRRLKTYLGKGIKITKSEEQRSAITKFPLPKGVPWSELTIKFVSNRVVWLKDPEKSEALPFYSLGLEHSTSKKPNVICLTLVSLAKFQEISRHTEGLHPRISTDPKSQIYRLKELFQKIFVKDDESPLKYNKKDRDWTPKFNLELADDEIYYDIYDDF